MKKLILLPILFLCLTIFAQDKLIRYNDLYLQNVKIEGLSINNELSNLGPCIINGELYFTSINTSLTGSKGKKSKQYYDLYSAQINSVGEIISSEKLITELSSEYHMGPISYNKKTGDLIITRNNVNDPIITPYKPVQEKSLKLEMILAKKEDGEWKIKNEYGHNNKKYSIGHPAFSPSGDTLIFVSDMPGGYGQTDLYYSVRLDEGWSSPKNLGPGINTSGKEFTPFVTKNGILIFATDGQENKDDLDLYYTLFSNLNNPVLVKFPEPFNSENDDFGMVVDSTNVYGYLSSDRPGKGGDDIFRIEFNIPYALLKGKVVNKLTQNPIENATINFSFPELIDSNFFSNSEGLFEVTIPKNQKADVTSNKERYLEETLKITDNESILFEMYPEILLDLTVIDAETKDLLTGVSVSFNDQEYLASEQNGQFSKILEGSKIYYIKGTLSGYLDNSITVGSGVEPAILKDTLLMYKKIVEKSFVVENIYYDFNKWDILPESAIELDNIVTILKENKTIKVELGSHTDSRGSDDFNLKLSDKRSQSAVDYIMSKGISLNQIIAKGYGESQPTIKFPKSEDEHRLNRRTTFKILEIDNSAIK